MCLSSLFPPGRPPEVGGGHSVSDGEKRGCCQPQLSPDISFLLLKTHLAARPLPLLSPKLFWGGICSTDALMAMTSRHKRFQLGFDPLCRTPTIDLCPSSAYFSSLPTDRCVQPAAHMLVSAVIGLSKTNPGISISLLALFRALLLPPRGSSW